MTRNDNSDDTPTPTPTPTGMEPCPICGQLVDCILGYFAAHISAHSDDDNCRASGHTIAEAAALGDTDADGDHSVELPDGMQGSGALAELQIMWPALQFISWDGDTLTVEAPASLVADVRAHCRQSGPWGDGCRVPVIVEDGSLTDAIEDAAPCIYCGAETNDVGGCKAACLVGGPYTDEEEAALQAEARAATASFGFNHPEAATNVCRYLLERAIPFEVKPERSDHSPWDWTISVPAFRSDQVKGVASIQPRTACPNCNSRSPDYDHTRLLLATGVCVDCQTCPDCGGVGVDLDPEEAALSCGCGHTWHYGAEEADTEAGPGPHPEWPGQHDGTLADIQTHCDRVLWYGMWLVVTEVNDCLDGIQLHFRGDMVSATRHPDGTPRRLTDPVRIAPIHVPKSETDHTNGDHDERHPDPGGRLSASPRGLAVGLGPLLRDLPALLGAAGLWAR